MENMGLNFEGSCSLGSFKITIEDKRPIKGELTEEDYQELFATFLHEYIHFIQIVSTLNGLDIIYTYIIQGCEILHDKTQFKIENLKAWLCASKEQKIKQYDKVGYKDCKKCDVLYKNETIDIRNEDGKVTPHDYELPIITLKDKHNGKLDEVDFGWGVILENMAKLVEQLVMPTKSLEKLGIEYYVVELVASCIQYGTTDNFFASEENPSEFKREKLLILAICEYSLRFQFQAGAFFLYCLDTLTKEQQEKSLQSVDGIFNYCKYVSSKFSYRDEPAHYKGNVRYILNRVSQFFGEEIKDKLEKFFSDIEQLREDKLPISKFVEKAMALSSFEEKKQSFEEFQNRITLQPTTYEFGKITQYSELIVFVIVEHILNMLFSKEQNIKETCPLISYCHEKYESIMDNNCCGTPHLRTRGCGFKNIWDKMGLDGFKRVNGVWVKN